MKSITFDKRTNSSSSLHPNGSLKGKKILQIILRYVVLAIVGFIFIFPFIYMFLSSLKPQAEIFQYAFPLSWKTLIPQTWTLENFVELINLLPYSFLHYLGNSIFVAIACTFGSLIINATAAYAFAKLNFPAKNILFGLFLITMMVPFEVLAIPLYLEMRTFNWIDSYEALIIPWIANASGIFLLRQFFTEIPKDLLDAARIDGCNYLSTFWYVVIPNSIPALITFSLIRFQASWDSFIWPLIVTPSPEKRLVQVAIATFTTEVDTRWGLAFGASVMATLPILITFLVFQRYYVKGVMMSGLKG